MKESEQTARCDDCGNIFAVPEDADLNSIPHVLDRIEPGAEVPICECPECGALSYLLEKK